MISKTKIDKRIKRKKNPNIVETIINLKKKKEWLKIAQIISSSTRKYSSVNLEEIDRNTKEGDTVVVPGKVLSSGEISKKIRIAALSFSDKAKEKLKSKKCEVVSILKEFKENPTARGIKVLR